MVTPDSRFDFERARERLADLQRALQSSEQSPDESRKLLQERAATYARAPERSLLASEQLEILTFEFSGEQYAIESRFVSEVLRAPSITDVPWTPDFLCGVINLRGEILAVMDLGGLLGSAPIEDRSQWVLVLSHDLPEFGIIVEDIHEVTRVRTESVLPPARAARETCRDWIRGVTENAVVVLDGRSVLDDRRLHIDVAET